MTPRPALVRALAALLVADVRSSAEPQHPASGVTRPGNARAVVGRLHPPAVTERPTTLAAVEAGKDGQANDRRRGEQ